MGSEKLEEVDVIERSDVELAMARILFHWGLAKRNGEHVVVEIWATQGAELTFERIG